MLETCCGLKAASGPIGEGGSEKEVEEEPTDRDTSSGWRPPSPRRGEGASLRSRILRHSLPPPTKQKTMPGSLLRRSAAASNVSSGCTGLWLPEYITTNLSVRPCAARNSARPVGSKRTASAC